MGKGISSSEFSVVEEVSPLLFEFFFSKVDDSDNVEFSLCKIASFVSFRTKRVLEVSFIEIRAFIKKMSKKKRNY